MKEHNFHLSRWWTSNERPCISPTCFAKKRVRKQVYSITSLSEAMQSRSHVLSWSSKASRWHPIQESSHPGDDKIFQSSSWALRALYLTRDLCPWQQRLGYGLSISLLPQKGSFSRQTWAKKSAVCWTVALTGETPVQNQSQRSTYFPWKSREQLCTKLLFPVHQCKETPLSEDSLDNFNTKIQGV